jgi:outer membrane protein TolC
MTMKHCKIILILFVLLVSGMSLKAQSIPKTSESGWELLILRSYIDSAMQDHPSIRQKWNEFQAMQKKIPQVNSLPDPELNLSILPVAMELPAGKQVADIQLMQMFPWFGVLKNAKKEMELKSKASLESVYETQLEIGYEIQARWWNLLRNRQLAGIAEKDLEIIRQTIRLTTTGIQSGMNHVSGNSLTDLYTMQSEEAGLQNETLALEDDFQTQQFAFNRLLNRSDDAKIQLPDSIEWVIPNDVSDSEFNSPTNRNHRLRILQYEQESLIARQKMNERMAYPSVGIGLKYSVLSKNPATSSMMNGKDMLMPMVSVTLPIYRKKYQSLRQENEWMRKSAEESLTTERNALVTELRQAHFDHRDALRRIQLYQTQKHLAEQTQQLLLKRQAVSQANLMDILNSSRRILEIKRQWINARIDEKIAGGKIVQLEADYGIKKTNNNDTK